MVKKRVLKVFSTVFSDVLEYFGISSSNPDQCNNGTSVIVDDDYRSYHDGAFYLGDGGLGEIISMQGFVPSRPDDSWLKHRIEAFERSKGRSPLYDIADYGARE